MSNKLIRAAFESTLNTWAAAQSPAIPVAWENVPFTPPAGKYLRAFLLPAQTDSQDLEGRHRGFRGVFQISVVMPIGAGAGGAETIVSALDALFPLTAPIVSGGLKVFIAQPLSAGPAQQEPDRFAVPCSIRYIAHTFT